MTGRRKLAAEKLSFASRSDRLAQMESDSSALLGKRAKQIRLRKKLRIVDVAERANLAMSTISKVENGQMALTYDKLLQLSQGLGVALPELLKADRNAGAPADAQGAEAAQGTTVTGRRAISRLNEGLYVKAGTKEYWYLCNDIARRAMSPMLCRSSAKTLDENGPLIRHPGEEFVFVLSGEVEMRTELYQPVRLKPGESMYFDSGMGHAYLSVGKEECRLLIVCSGLTDAHDHRR
jgi:transcriptional regulator with XRE-family HTH domain